MKLPAAIASLALLALNCGDAARTPPCAGELRGAYDTTVRPGSRGEDETVVLGVADLDGDNQLDITLRFSLWDNVYLHGRMQPDGSVQLLGERWIADVVWDLTGSAMVTSRDDEWQITGRAEPRLPARLAAPGLAFSFRMSRPVDGGVQLADGPYVFSFSPSLSNRTSRSEAVLWLGFSCNGAGSSARQVYEREASHLVLGTITAGPCWLSPGGMFGCEMSYSDPADEGATYPSFKLLGTLVPQDDGIAGSGRFRVGFGALGDTASGKWEALLAKDCTRAQASACTPGEFCRLEGAECSVGNRLGVCAQVPEACPELYAPVCGCDGTTYANACFADLARVSLDHPGECEPPIW